MKQIISRKEAKELGLIRYFTGKPCVRKHIEQRKTSDGKCLECQKEKSKEKYYRNRDKILEQKRKYQKENRESRIEYQKQYRSKNKDAISKRNKDWADKNRDRIKSNTEKYYRDNKEKRLQYAKYYREKNRDRILQEKKDHYQKNKDKFNQYKRAEYKRRSKEDPSYIAVRFMRKCIYRVLSSKTKECASVKYGYERSDLVLHIEKQFTKGMSWENYGKWHIDHITPVSQFIREGVFDPLKINCLSNLRPVWASVNLKKGDRAHFLL